MAPLNNEELATLLYQTFWGEGEGEIPQPDDRPTWDMLPKHTRDDWRAQARRVLKTHGVAIRAAPVPDGPVCWKCNVARVYEPRGLCTSCLDTFFPRI